MEKSNTIGELAKALVDFQSTMNTVVFDASNPFFKSKYATLAQLVSASRELLTSHGLAVSQLTEETGSVTTILMHTSGEYLSSKLTLTPAKNDPQGLGSAITYARRYAYASILGLVADDDDDGNAATHGAKKEDKKEPKEPPPTASTNKSYIETIGVQKFGDLDKFTAWRIDNNFPEKLDKLDGFMVAKISNAIRDAKPIK